MTYRALYPTARSPQKYGASRHTPLICVNVFSANSNRQIPLFTKSIQRAIDLRDLAYSRWKTFRTVELKFQYSAARANVNKCIRCAKMEYYSRRFAFAMETRQTWRTIREIGLCNTHHNTSCQIDPNDLNKSFVNTPWCGLIQISIAFIVIMLILILVLTLTSLGLNVSPSMMSCRLHSLWNLIPLEAIICILNLYPDVIFLVLLDLSKAFGTFDHSFGNLNFSSDFLIHLPNLYARICPNAQNLFFCEANGLIIYLWRKVYLRDLFLDHFFLPVCQWFTWISLELQNPFVCRWRATLLK